LKFSNDGKKIFAIGEDGNHTLAAYEVAERIDSKSKKTVRAMLGTCSTDM